MARTIAVARLMLPDMNIQAPPNLSPLRPPPVPRRRHQRLGRHLAADPRLRESRSPVAAGRRRWRDTCARRGLHAARRGCRSMPSTSTGRAFSIQALRAPRRSSPPPRRSAPCGMTLRDCRARSASARAAARAPRRPPTAAMPRARARRRRAERRRRASTCCSVDGDDFAALVRAADHVRAADVGDEVTYVVNRNINWTNICFVGCQFCAFAVHRKDPTAYNHSIDDVLVKVQDAVDRGATEVCMQGGINPEIGRVLLPRPAASPSKHAIPQLHMHAFSPMEIMYGARRTGMTYRDYLDHAARRRPRHHPRHRRRDPRRRRARDPQPQEGRRAHLGRDHHHRARARHPLELDGHVRPHRDAGARRPPPRPAPRPAEADRRLHRVRAAALHPHADRSSTRRAWSTRRRSARSTCASTPSRGSCCAAGSTTCRRRG